MNPSRPQSEECDAAGRMLHNMSAAPTSTVTFAPYGAQADAATGRPSSMSPCGLRRIIRAAPDVLIQSRLPATYRRLQELANAGEATEARGLRMAALVRLAAALVDGTEAADDPAMEVPPLELLLDRLADLAARLPPAPVELPAMAPVEPVTAKAGASQGGTADTLAALWILTHVNGRTFNRDGLPLLVPDLASGPVYDLYAS
jgi:hypothetical protein